MSGSSGSAGGQEAAVAPASVDERRAANERAFAADRRHRRTATVRVVNKTAMKATKKARGSRAMRVRATRVIMETSLREEGDDGHNNQLGTKAAATARTVVATTVRAITMAARATATGAKMAMALAATMATMMTMATMATMAMTTLMAMTVTMTPNGDDNYKNQAAMTARMTMMVARAMVTGSKKAMATIATMVTTGMMATTATMATMATMTPNSNNAASGDKGNKDTKQ
jgi:hypothetical protein